MDLSWINTSWTAIAMVVLSTLGIYISIIVFTRIAGLHSFAKMSSFDFAITIAIGAVIGNTILTNNPPLLQAIIGLAAMYILQLMIAKLRLGTSFIGSLLDNRPLLLMKGDQILEKNLKKAKMTRADLNSGLRAANVTQLGQVKAVVMESTGEISVLHHENPEHELDAELLKEVEGGYVDFK